MLIVYTGRGEYVDPGGRFVANTGDVVDIDDEEARELLRLPTWKAARARKGDAGEVTEGG